MEKVNLKQTATSREMILALVMTLFVSFFFYSMIISPKGEELEAINKKLKEIQIEEKALMTIVAKLSQKKEKIEQVTAQLSSENIKVQILNGNYAPEIKAIDKLMNRINEIENKTGFRLHAYSSERPVNQSDYKMTSINLKGYGPYAKLVEFIDSLDKIPTLLSIQTFVIAPNEVIKGEMNLDLQATFYSSENINAY